MIRRILVFAPATVAVTPATVAVALAVVAVALAVGIPVTTKFTGRTRHGHYGVNLVPECFTSACTRATTIAVQVTTGNARHPGGKCVYGTFQLPAAKLNRGRFGSTGRVLAGSKTITLKAVGVFTTSTRAHGTVTGPRACGGAERFRLSGVAR